MQSEYDKDGVHHNSTTNFCTPGEYAKKNLFYVEMSGHYWCNDKYHVKRAELDSYLLIWTLNGSGIVKSGTGEHVCQRSDIMLIDCNEAHEYYTKDHWEFYWLHFRGGSSSEIVNFMQEFKYDHTHVEETSIVMHIFLQLCQKGEHLTIDAEINTSALLHQLLSGIIQQALLQQRNTRKIERITEAVTYFEEHFTEEIRLDVVAQNFYVSKSSFCHKFKLETGFSPYEYILTKRINMAKYLLKTTKKTISEISLMVGFQSEANFTKHFKKRNGMSPSAFRQVKL